MSDSVEDQEALAPSPEDRDLPGELRERLRRVAEEAALSLQLLAVLNPRRDPTVLDVPIDGELAAELLQRCRAYASGAAEAELREHLAGFTPSEHQQVYTAVPDGPLAAIDEQARQPTHQPLSGDTKLGRNNILVMRLLDEDGRDVARFYQGLGSMDALERARGRLVIWQNGQFHRLTQRPLLLDTTMRVVVLGDLLLMTRGGEYERLFGPLPDTREQAAATYAETLATLDIEGGDALAEACASELNMMRKLASIRRKLQRPGYRDAFTQVKIVAFIRANEHVPILLDGDGADAKIVHRNDPQHRWALLKLLDDDFLHSSLTEIDYEANSKSEM